MKLVRITKGFERTLLIVLSLTLAFLGGWLVKGHARAGIRASPQTALPASTVKLTPLDDAMVLSNAPALTPSERASASMESPTISSPTKAMAAPTLLDAFDILNQALATRIEVPYAEDAYQSKYQGITLDDMRIAETVLRKQVRSESDRISHELFEQGRFETQIVSEGQKATTPQASGNDPIVSFGFKIEPHEGYSTVMTATIPPGEYPEFDSLKQEVRWLGTYIRRHEQD